MTTAADITAANTAIGLVADANTKSALQAVMTVIGDLNTQQGADTTNIATLQGQVAGLPQVSGGFGFAKLTRNGVDPAAVAQPAGQSDSDPTASLAVPGAVVVNNGTRMSWTTGQSLSGTHAVAYSQQLASTGGTGAVTYALVGGAFPGGVTMNTAGLISGTPAAAGTYQFVITATDSIGDSISQLFSLTVA